LSGVQTPSAQDRPQGSIPVPGAPAPAPQQHAEPASVHPQQLPPELSVRPQPRPGKGARPLTESGLTAPGVFVVVGAVSLVAMIVDTFVGSGVGWLFGGFFVAVSGYAALQVRRTDLLWAVIAPPLVFAVLVCGHASWTTTGDLLPRVVALGNALFDQGPILWIGTGLAAGIVAWRYWRR
jgi:hypothetical protein